MAFLSGEGTPGFSIKNGCKVYSDQVFTVEEVLLAMGEIVEHENIVSASRMNKAVVVFLKDEKHVNDLVENGIVVNDTLVQVVPLRTPATKVTISSVPPFIPNEQILKELNRFGKFAGSVKMVPFGCKNVALKHVLSFRWHVFMFLNAQSKTLDISFRIQHGDSSYMVYATTESLRCFECGDLGHKKLKCTHKKQLENEKNDGMNEERNDQSISSQNKEKRPTAVKDVVIPGKKQKTTGINGNSSGMLDEPSVVSEVGFTTEQSAEGSSSTLEVSAFTSTLSAGDNAVSPSVLKENTAVDKENDGVGGNVVLKESCLESEVIAENENSDENMEDCDDNCSEFSEIECSQSLDDVYSVEELNAFLDSTKGKKTDIVKHFPDSNKFIKSVLIAQKNVGYEVLSKQKRFRLSKFVTTLRKAQEEQGRVSKRKK